MILAAATLLGAGIATAATTIGIRIDDSEARASLMAMRGWGPGPAAEAERLGAALRELRRHAGTLQAEAAQRLAALIPTGTDFDATVHVLGPGDRTRPASRDPNGVPLPIADYATGNSGLDVNALFAGMVREVYRVAFRAAGGPPPRPAVHSQVWDDLSAVWGPDVVGEVWRHSGSRRWNGIETKIRLEAWVPPSTWTTDGLDRFLHLLTRMQEEGCAVLASAPPRATAGAETDPAGVRSWEGTARTDWPLLSLAARALDHGASGHEIDRVASQGFGSEGPLVRVGYHMARRIELRTGRRALIQATTGGPIAFVDAYLATHPDGPGHVDEGTARILRAVSREIRAVGAFRVGE